MTEQSEKAVGEQGETPVAKTRAEEEHEDCLEMQRVIKEKLGIEVSERTCLGMWAGHSESYAAGWLGVNSDLEIIQAFMEYGPLAEIEQIYNQIKGLDSGFRIMLLSKIDRRFCRSCGDEVCLMCMKCRLREEDKKETAGEDS